MSTPLRARARGLFDLPPEIREVIYVHILLSECAWLRPVSIKRGKPIEQSIANPCAYWLRPIGTKGDEPITSRALDVSIMCTNKQVCHEARETVFKHGKVMWLESAAEKSNAIQSRKKELFKKSRHLALAFDKYHLSEKALRHLKLRANLRTLRVYLGSAYSLHFRYVKDLPKAVETEQERLKKMFRGVQVCGLASVSGSCCCDEMEATLKEVEKGIMKSCRCEKDERGCHIEDISFGKLGLECLSWSEIRATR